MRPFAYRRATDRAGATRSASNTNAAIIAGGTNLLDLMKLQVETPSTLVDVSRLDLKKIMPAEDGGLRVGALVTNSELAAHARVRDDYEVLSRALLSGASGQLRNRATTGGNLLQRTRCNYFQDTSSRCNKRAPGSGCDAMEGLNRILAVLGTSDQCIATHPSDMAVAMQALDANIDVLGVDGTTRSVPMQEFHKLPGNTPHIETVLQVGDLITDVTLPKPVAGSFQTYRKARDRASYAFALVSIAAVTTMKDGRFDHVALAFGGLAPKPWRDREVEGLLSAEKPSEALFSKAADLLLSDAHGHGHNDFKIPLARRMLTSVLREASES
ncbi:xanthine dehydrogenase family protein subunit M [Rhizobiaceae bacterium]|nr:xanthine dehydrogenase family protein subunit M [Rhizobiaceae bacterium]